VAEDGLDSSDPDAMALRLESMRARHRELDTEIRNLEAEGPADIRIMGLKREKLRLKDQILWLSALLTPDIIA